MKKSIVLLALSVISVPALATDLKGFYGSVGGGVYQLESGAFDDNAPSMEILAGYQFNEIVAVEAAYTRLFESSDQVDDVRVEVDGNAWDLRTKLSYPMAERFRPFVRMGWSYVDLSAVATDSGVSVRVNDYDNAFAWAVGSDVNVTRRISLTGEFARTMIDEGDLDFLSLKLNYGFGGQ